MRNKITSNYNLAVVNPALAREWHPTKNGLITPGDVAPHARKKIWWLCNKGHEWQMTVDSRGNGYKCPYCSGRAVNETNCLQTLNPALAREWHPAKNDQLTPHDVTAHSNRKIWWRCNKGHEWYVSVAHRSRGRGCPYCSRRLASPENCLVTVNPNLAKEWHPTKNGELTPKDVTPFANKKVWWLCKRGHEWEASVAHRNIGTGCPRCHSQTSWLELRVYTEFQYLFEDVKHRKKIHGVEIDIYIPNSNIGIEIDSLMWHKNRMNKDSQKTELLKRCGVFFIRVREQGLALISENDVIFSQKDKDLEVVKRIAHIILKTANLDIDIKNRLSRYLKDNKYANDDEFVKLRYMLPAPLPGKSLLDFDKNLSAEWHPTKNKTLAPKDVFPFSPKKVWWICKKGHEWQAKIFNRTNGRGCPYCSGKLAYEDNCLQTLNPILSREWHPTKNGKLTPNSVTEGSDKSAWWLCSKGHEWKASISHRVGGTNCPYCTGRLVCSDNCLTTVNPDIAREWHPTKNGKLTPNSVTEGSHKSAWWLCSKGHEWKSMICNRKKEFRCPYCYGMQPSKEHNLFVKNPSLAKEWHPTKNGNLKPTEVTPHSNKKVWWMCREDHEWQATINNRDDKHRRGCPYCSGRRK